VCGSQITGVDVCVGRTSVRVSVGGIGVNVGVITTSVGAEVNVGIGAEVGTGAQEISNKKIRKSIEVDLIHYSPRRREGYEDPKIFASFASSRFIV
jgi:hypothetical protein